MSLSILQVTNLTKRFGAFTAVDGISFSLAKGEIVGFLGPNGAGKTTTINMLLGLLEPTSGTVHIFDKALSEKRSEIAGRMNFTTTSSFLPGNLTVRENLFIFGMLYGVSNLRQRIGEVLALMQLERFAKQKTGVLSSGEQSRLSLAKALLNKPELLLLDEPTASLDPQSAREMRALIKNEVGRRGITVLWTSHNMSEIEAVCNRVLLLSKGKILLEGDPKTLPANHGKENLEELFIAVANESLQTHEG